MCLMCMMMHVMDGLGHDAQAMPATASPGKSDLDILNRCYALGEITQEQFNEMKQALGVPDASSANQQAHYV